MGASYLALGLDGEATFELFVRSLPPERRFLVAAGLEPALDHLEGLALTAEERAWLPHQPWATPALLSRLEALRFTGEVWAVPEGTVVVAGEPLLRVTAPLVEASLVETALLNVVGHSTVVASKAARVALASGERPFVDFSARRDHGPSAALLGARAAAVAGAAGTSLVSAGVAYDLPLTGTMAHAYVLRLGSEEEAFRAYARTVGGPVTLLLDTYDTVEGARRAVRVAREGVRVDAVRLDSGDLGALATEVRAVLDEGGCPEVRIVVSGDLDEHVVARLVASGAPVDSFGVGTRMGTSADAPTLGVVYKLVEDVDGPRAKRSSGKATLPGRKQVWRRVDGDGVLAGDVVALDGEEVAGAAPLLERVVAGGRRLRPAPPLEEAAGRCRAGLASLPPALRRLEPVEAGEPGLGVEVSPGLRGLAERVSGAPAPTSLGREAPGG